MNSRNSIRKPGCIILLMVMLMLGWSTTSTADELYLQAHGMSHHPRNDNTYNSRNYGLGLLGRSGVSTRSLGTYLNSDKRWSVYSSVGREYGWWGFEVGLVTGYEYPVTPYLVPTLRYKWVKVRLILEPVTVVGVSLEVPIRSLSTP